MGITPIFTLLTATNGFNVLQVVSHIALLVVFVMSPHSLVKILSATPKLWTWRSFDVVVQYVGAYGLMLLMEEKIIFLLNSTKTFAFLHFVIVKYSRFKTFVEEVKQQ